MAQTVILASGTTAASSSPRTIAAGVEFKVVAYTTGQQWPQDAYIEVNYDTPGDNQPIGRLSADEPGVSMTGPITYIVTRNPQSRALAVIEET